VADTDVDIIDDLRTIISIQAHRLMRKYHRYVEYDDLTQELWVYGYRKHDKFVEFLTREDKDEQRQGWSAAHKSMWREGDKYCRTVKAEALGYRPGDEAFYDASQVRQLVEMSHNGTSYTNQVDDRPKVKRIPGSGYMLETSIADLHRAMKVLSPEERGILMHAYGDGVPEEEVAEAWDMPRAKVRRTLKRATKKIIDELGGESPW
jgi:RNA polymerase sigma factor (sigma-70 family)